MCMGACTCTLSLPHLLSLVGCGQWLIAHCHCPSHLLSTVPPGPGATLSLLQGSLPSFAFAMAFSFARSFSGCYFAFNWREFTVQWVFFSKSSWEQCFLSEWMVDAGYRWYLCSKKLPQMLNEWRLGHCSQRKCSVWFLQAPGHVWP